MNKKKLYKRVCKHVAPQLRESPTKEALLKGEYINWKRTFYTPEGGEISRVSLLKDIVLGEYITLVEATIPVKGEKYLRIDILVDGVEETIALRKPRKKKSPPSTKKRTLCLDWGFKYKKVLLVMTLISILGLIPFVNAAMVVLLTAITVTVWNV